MDSLATPERFEEEPPDSCSATPVNPPAPMLLDDSDVDEPEEEKVVVSARATGGLVLSPPRLLGFNCYSFSSIELMLFYAYVKRAVDGYRRTPARADCCDFEI